MARQAIREGAAMTDHPKPADLVDTTQGPPHPAVGAKRHRGLTMKKLKNTKHPIQPIGKDEHGVVRFKRNAIVCHLLDHGGIDLNQIAALNFSREDQEQFAQLIGYSHSGAHDLSYMSSEVLAAAEAGGTDADRAEYLRDQLDGLREALRKPMATLFGKHPDDLKGSP